MFGFGNLTLSVEDFIDEIKRIINDKEEMERLTGNGLSKKENKLLYLFNFICDNTKFKKVSLNHLEDITFETSNRKYLLSFEEDNKFGDTFILEYETKEDKRKYEAISGTSYFECFNDLEKWFKRRNYLKG